MKNQAKEERAAMKLRERPALAARTRACRKKSVREKRSPPTREFGTDLTNRPQLVANQPEESSGGWSSPPEITPYLPAIMDHMSCVDQCFTDRAITRLASSADMSDSRISP